MTVAIGNYVAEFEGTKLRIADTNFEVALVSGKPTFAVDSGDYYDYDRATNTHGWYIGSTLRASLTATVFDLPLSGLVGGNFFFGVSGANPEITFDTGGDGWQYDRAANNYLFNIASVTKFAVSASYAQVGVDGSAPALILAAMDGVNEGGELQINGAAANLDWTHDNYVGNLRWIASGVVRMQLSTASLTIGADGSAPLLTLAAIDGVNSGGSIVLNGAAANSDWIHDNYAGTIRWSSASTTYLELTTTKLRANNTMEIDGDLDHDGSNIGFFATAPAAKQTVTGSRGANAALASLLTALATYGLLVDSSTV